MGPGLCRCCSFKVPLFFLRLLRPLPAGLGGVSLDRGLAVGHGGTLDWGLGVALELGLGVVGGVGAGGVSPGGQAPVRPALGVGPGDRPDDEDDNQNDGDPDQQGGTHPGQPDGKTLETVHQVVDAVAIGFLHPLPEGTGLLLHHLVLHHLLEGEVQKGVGHLAVHPPQGGGEALDLVPDVAEGGFQGDDILQLLRLGEDLQQPLLLDPQGGEVGLGVVVAVGDVIHALALGHHVAKAAYRADDLVQLGGGDPGVDVGVPLPVPAAAVAAAAPLVLALDVAAGVGDGLEDAGEGGVELLGLQLHVGVADDLPGVRQVELGRAASLPVRAVDNDLGGLFTIFVVIGFFRLRRTLRRSGHRR